MTMLEWLFSFVCGQVHRWILGGTPLPLCERCTGLYVGGAVAAALIILLRPRPTHMMLWVHGLAMLVMIPFGYHLVRQTAVSRTITGLLFAFGLTYFLALVPAGHILFWRGRSTARQNTYFALAICSFPTLLILLRTGGRVTRELISIAALTGLVIYSLLAIATTVFLLRQMICSLRGASVSER